jgi:hypothetical protein
MPEIDDYAPATLGETIMVLGSCLGIGLVGILIAIAVFYFV